MVSFSQVLENYEFNLKSIHSWVKRTQNYKEGCERYNGMRSFFHDIKREYDLDLLYGLNKPNSPLIRRKPTEEEIKEMSDKNFPLIGVLVYRNLKGFIYLDDSGQQEFIKCEGQEWSGGAYNTNPEIDFSDFMDDIADSKTLESED